MRLFRKGSSATLLFALLFLEGTTVLSAADLSYDRYAPVGDYPALPSAKKNIASHFLVYPFEILRWPVDQGLVYIEKHHIDKKVKWVYDFIEDQGITPRANVVSVGSFGAGMDVDFIRVLRQKERLPDGMFKSWIQWTKDVHFEVGTEVGIERIGNTGFLASTFFQYEDRPEEHFYGIGPDTSAGDGTAYQMEMTTIEPKIGYRFNPTHNTELKLGYRNINITEGEHEGRGIPDKIFFPQTIPGIEGDDILTAGWEYSRDSRNRQEDSTTGGHQRLGVSFNEGVNGSEARYFKYQAEASQFFRLGSDRRVLALHFYGEHNDEMNRHHVPFHQMAKLGGFGSYPRLSHTLRGFDFNRFFDESAALFNLEYRYTIWEYRDFKLDTILFWDEGQVFGEFSEFQLKDFRESYGGGFRLGVAHHIIFAVEIAHGDEGTHFYVKSSAPF